MRCLSCNKTLSDFEATRKFADSESFVDLCTKCDTSSDFTGIEIIVRPDLITEEEIEIIDPMDDAEEPYYDEQDC